MYKYDMHVATETSQGRDELHAALLNLGFKDDELAERGLMFDKRTAQYYPSSCPLIDIHMSRKIVDRPELTQVEIEVDRAMEAAQVPGYWHSEYIDWDVRLVHDADRSFCLRPFFCQSLESRPRDAHKVWDLHLCFLEDDLPGQLRDELVNHGLYYLARYKMRQGERKRYAVFTVQGVNDVKTEGYRFVKELVFWLGHVGAPSCDLKMEITTRMQTYCNTSLVPPTIDTILWT